MLAPLDQIARIEGSWCSQIRRQRVRRMAALAAEPRERAAGSGKDGGGSTVARLACQPRSSSACVGRAPPSSVRSDTTTSIAEQSERRLPLHGEMPWVNGESTRASDVSHQNPQARPGSAFTTHVERTGEHPGTSPAGTNHRRWRGGNALCWCSRRTPRLRGMGPRPRHERPPASATVRSRRFAAT
jgi:hypothetical protein